IYRPLRGPVAVDREAVPSGIVREIHVRADDGLILHGWHATSKIAAEDDRSRPLVLFFPGNSGHRGRRQRDLELFTQIGADVLLVDYRGYAENKGRPSEMSIAADARAIWRFAIGTLQRLPERIVLLGGSLG